MKNKMKKEINPKKKNPREIKGWAMFYKNYFVGTYKTKREAEISIKPDPKGFTIRPYLVKILSK